MISPSELLVVAADLKKPQGISAPSPGRCAMCGHSHKKGDRVRNFDPPSSFTDLPSLASPESEFVCLACVAIWTKDFLQRFSKSVVCFDGVFPAASNDHIAYWLMNPPPPPFLFYISDQQQQHLVWRTPVNQSSDIYFVRFGGKIMTIRKQYLVEAVQSSQILAKAISDERQAAGNNNPPLKSPFMVLARENDNRSNGTIRSDVIRLSLTMPSLVPHIETLRACTPGEIWALSAVLYAKNPHRPETSLSLPLPI